MRTDEEEEASKCYFRNSFCPFLSALFFVRLKIQGTERTKTDKKHDPPPPFTRKLKDLLYYRLWNLVGKGNKVVYIT